MPIVPYLRPMEVLRSSIYISESTPRFEHANNKTISNSIPPMLLVNENINTLPDESLDLKHKMLSTVSDNRHAKMSQT